MVREAQMKTHSRENITHQFAPLNPCINHGCRPTVYDIVSGKQREHYYIVVCERIEDGKEIFSDECGKISSESPNVAINAWQKWNPIAETENTPTP